MPTASVPKCAKVFADGEESDKHLASAAIVKLCSMLDELDTESELNPPPELLKKPANSRKPFIIALAGIGAAILLCVILTVVLGSGSGKALFCRRYGGRLGHSAKRDL